MRKPADKAANKGLFQLDPTFGDMAVKMGSATWGIDTLSQREKALLCLMADVCDHNLGLAFEMHIEMALANDVPLRDIREVIFHAAPEAGYSNALQALIRFKQVAKERNYGKEEDDGKEDHDLSNRASDPGLNNKLDALAEGFSETWSVAVGQQWERPNLSMRERALLAIAADVINQTLGEPFSYRVRTARASGVSRVQIQDTIRFLAEFGASKAWQALSQLNHVAEQLSAA